MKSDTFPQLRVKAGVGQTMGPDQKPTFEKWMMQIAWIMQTYRGAHPDDLPDQPWRDWYDDRLRPIRAANRALKAFTE